MAREIYDTATLLEVMSEQDRPSNYWMDLLFPEEITFTDEYVDFEKIPRAKRKLAPFVAPMAQGQPIYENGSRVQRFKPAYVKPKDPVNPNRVMSRRPGEILQRQPDSPESRYNAVIGDITQYHRTTIERRWEWLAAQAAIYGEVTIEGDNYPRQLVQFGRDAGHTIVLGAGSRWGEGGVSIIDNVQSWVDQMHLAEFGGAPSVLTMGVSAWAVARKDAELKDQMDTDFIGRDGTDFNRGLLQPGEVRTVGAIGHLRVDVYNDFYEVDGVSTPFMDPRDIVLSGPAVDGHRCFGAILDPNAEFQPLSIYPRSFVENDPPVTFVMSQSAPLMVPINPNATLRARVVA